MDSLFPEFDNRKVCLNCNILKPICDFYGRHVSKNDWCKNCLRKARKNVPPGKKFCTICKEAKDIEEFHPDVVHGKPRITSWCEPCNKKRTNDLNRARYDPREGRSQHLHYTYGITLEEYEAMLRQQGGVCAICKQPETYLHPRWKTPNNLVVDHNHKTGKIRALLCQHCNRALGLLRDDIEFTKTVLQYLLEHQE